MRVISEGLRQEVTGSKIRVTIVSPGAVLTELADSVTESNTSKAVHEMYEKIGIPADSFARVVVFAMSQPEDVDINEMFRPTAQEY